MEAILENEGERLNIECMIINNNNVEPNHENIRLVGLVNLHCSITCSSDPFFRDVAARKLAVVGRQCEKNNKNRARTSGKSTLEHIQSTARTDNYTKNYQKNFRGPFLFEVHGK